MSRLASRIVLTLLLFPALVVCGFITGGVAALVNRFFDDMILLLGAVSFNATGFAAGFWAVWRGVVVWTPRRSARTAAWSGGCVALGILSVAGLLLWLDRWDVEPWLVVAIAAVTLLWMVGCVRLWQESPSERAARIAAAGVSTALCPVCKYDLSGLTNLKCPECGNEFTLGRLQDEQRRRLSPPGLD